MQDLFKQFTFWSRSG